MEEPLNAGDTVYIVWPQSPGSVVPEVRKVQVAEVRPCRVAVLGLWPESAEELVLRRPSQVTRQELEAVDWAIKQAQFLKGELEKQIAVLKDRRLAVHKL